MNLSRNNRVKYCGPFGGQRKKGGPGFKNLKWKFYVGGAGDTEALVGGNGGRGFRKGENNKDRLLVSARTLASELCQLEVGSTTPCCSGARRLCQSDMERIGTGLVLTIVAMSVAALVEKKRKRIAVGAGLILYQLHSSRSH
ncbi:hypothetical protein LIER_38408 [Lithospermum erythrorhizon]|uniref:Uncharacterized protein n=1 Tax=Lithospermum erythrorhizon TaxID=34254 RepID=A0AAV3PZF8_LITER